MKKVIIAALAIAAFSAAYADVIYWMVSDEAYEDPGNDNPSANPYAWVVATDGNDVISFKDIDGRSAGQVATAYEYSNYFSTDLGAYSGTGWSYYVELWNGMQSASDSWDNLVHNGYISRPGDIGMPTTLAGGAFGQVPGTSYNVPEPTSGLLFLVGGMLLGLKRRRQQV